MSLSVNLVGASRVTGDKGLTLALLRKEGYRTPHGVQSDRIKVLENFVKENQGSFIVKPNSGSQAKGLSRINSLSELTTAFNKAKEFGSTVRVEEEIVGQHLSAGVAFGKVYFVYTKEPFSAGGMIVDIMDLVSEEVKNHLAQVTQLFNLNISSVDFIYCDYEEEVKSSKNCVIIEINSAPSFRKYAEMGDAQLSRVESLYRKVLESILKQDSFTFSQIKKSA